MAFDYTEANQDAGELIVEFGQASSFVVAGTGSGGYDDYGNVTAADPDTTISGIVTPLLRYKQREIDGEQILSTDSYVFFHSDVEPPIDSKVTINGTTYRSVNVVKIDSVDGINVYRKIQLRGG